MNWSMSGHDRRHWKALYLTDHFVRAILEFGQTGADECMAGQMGLFRYWFIHSILPDVTLRLWFEGQ
jgi:hypothetical protein